MKLTTRQLKQIIKEEVTSMYSGNPTSQITDVIVKTLNRMMLAPAPLETAAWELRGLENVGDRNKIINDVTMLVTQQLHRTIHELVKNVVDEIGKKI